MTTYCEVINEQIEAVSTVKIALAIHVTEAVVFSNTLITTIPVHVSEVANVTSSETDTADSLFISSGTASSSISIKLTARPIVVEEAVAGSFVTTYLPILVTETANILSSVVIPSPGVSIASTANISTTASGTLKTVVKISDGLLVTDSILLFSIAQVLASAEATSTVFYKSNYTELVISTAQITSTLDVPQHTNEFVSSSANALTAVTILTQGFLKVLSEGIVTSEVWSKNKEALAWVMNTETTAMSYYINYGFSSIAQFNDTIFATDGDGIYVITGEVDVEDNINSKIMSGMMDFKIPNTKRVEAAYFAYTSAGDITLDVEASDRPGEIGRYVLEARPSDSAVNTRAILGKGLSGRYWRFTLSANDTFSVNDQFVDVAVSQRRV